MSTTLTVVITGGNKGIGKATAITFAKKGYNVVVSSRDVSKAAELVKEIEQAGGKGLVVKTDVTKEEDIQNLVAESVKKFGKIDAFVNNAGIIGDMEFSLADSSTQTFQNVLNTNVLGTYWGMKYAIKEMLKTGGGSIVNVSSISGQIAFANMAHYAASKHAVNGLTKATALEYATKGIRVNAIAPGPVRTEIFDGSGVDEEALAKTIPIQKLGRPEDVANGIFYLASPENTFMTGSILLLDGGYVAQ